MRNTVVDVDCRDGNDLFIKCCPGVINYRLNRCRLTKNLDNSSHTPKRAEHSGANNRTIGRPKVHS